jgi:hypothetical protein
MYVVLGILLYHSSNVYAQAHCLSYLWNAAIPVTIPSSYNIGTYLMAKLMHFDVSFGNISSGHYSSRRLRLPDFPPVDT